MGRNFLKTALQMHPQESPAYQYKYERGILKAG